MFKTAKLFPDFLIECKILRNQNENGSVEPVDSLFFDGSFLNRKKLLIFLFFMFLIVWLKNTER